jgi:hypothetical protein
MKEGAMASTQPNLKAPVTYASDADFCRIFNEDMKDLHLLSLLLTADAAKAEQCFVAGLNDCSAGNRVFKEWARSWARRAIIKNAVRLIAPEATYTNGVSSNAVDANHTLRPELQLHISALLNLGSFERFAFVMSVLEGYSDQDCALLLGCTRQALSAARVRAVQEVARSVSIQERPQANATLKSKDSLIGLFFPARLATPA